LKLREKMESSQSVAIGDAKRRITGLNNDSEDRMNIDRAARLYNVIRSDIQKVWNDVYSQAALAVDFLIFS
jgi:hypothetical protein